ncbi:unnamed protein product, partial [Adineta steineri]
MNLRLVVLIGIILTCFSYTNCTFKYSTESYHSLYSPVGNPNISPEYDCALRAFTIEMAAYIAPPAVKTNWTTLAESAFQMNQCNNTLYST